MKFLKPSKPETWLIVLRLLSFIILSAIALSLTPDKLSLVFPTGGVTIPNNIPTLIWSPVSCNYYLVRVDNQSVDTVKSTLNMLVPFPLSFGKHTWQVEAVTHSGRIKSEKGTFTIDDQPLMTLPAGAVLLRHNWKMQSSLLVKENGEKLSTAGTVTKGWFPSSLPVTVLSVLVRNGVYPDPYKGMNNMRISDSNDAYNKKYDLLRYSHIPGKNPWKDPYWFRTEFEVPANLAGTSFRMNFSEINYRADVWLNGKQIADHKSMEGMERLFSFDVSALLKTKGANCLAVAIYPVDNPGEPGVEPLTPLGEPGTNMGDGWISKSYTKWDAIGWDWQPAIRDRDMGITGEVYLSATSAVELTNLYVTADLPLPDTTSAKIQLSAGLVNHSDAKISGFIKTTISGGDSLVVFNQPFSVEPLSTLFIDRNSQAVPELLFKNPRLWWPFGYGKQNLYTLKMEVNSGGKMLTSESVIQT